MFDDHHVDFGLLNASAPTDDAASSEAPGSAHLTTVIESNGSTSLTQVGDNYGLVTTAIESNGSTALTQIGGK